MSGFSLSRSQSSGEYVGKVETYHVAATHASILAPGDVVVLTGTAHTDGTPQVDAGAAGVSTTGVIASIDPTISGEALSDTGLPASTAGTVKVMIGEHDLYEVDVTNGPLAVTDTGLNANLIATAATKTGGLTSSNMTLNATGKATTATLNFQIVRLLEGSDGVLGSRALVRPNNTTMSAGATGK